MGFIDYSGPYLLSRGNFGILTCLRSVPGAPGRTPNLLKIGKNRRKLPLFPSLQVNYWILRNPSWVLLIIGAPLLPDGVLV